MSAECEVAECGGAADVRVDFGRDAPGEPIPMCRYHAGCECRHHPGAEPVPLAGDRR